MNSPGDSKTWSVLKQKQLSWFLCHEHVLWAPVHSDLNASIKLLSLLQKMPHGNSRIGVELWLLPPSPAMWHCWKLCAPVGCSQTGNYCCHSESVQTSPQHPAILPSLEPFYLQTFMTWPIMPFLCCFHVLKLVKSHRLCVQINFAISCIAGCDWFIQVPAWRWCGPCQALTARLIAVCLLL